jgi:hypothetical protein
MSGRKRLTAALDDEAILKCLDDNWCTVSQVGSRLRQRDSLKMATALDRLAKAGRIDQYALETGAPKRRGKIVIRFFRRSQSNTHDARELAAVPRS